MGGHLKECQARASTWHKKRQECALVLYKTMRVDGCVDILPVELK